MYISVCFCLDKNNSNFYDFYCVTVIYSIIHHDFMHASLQHQTHHQLLTSLHSFFSFNSQSPTVSFFVEKLSSSLAISNLALLLM